MPSHYLFEKQSTKYQEEVLPNVKTLAIEAGSSMSWYKYTKNVFGLDTFGVSAPGSVAMNHYGFNTEEVVKRFKQIK